MRSEGVIAAFVAMLIALWFVLFMARTSPPLISPPLTPLGVPMDMGWRWEGCYPLSGQWVCAV